MEIKKSVIFNKVHVSSDLSADDLYSEFKRRHYDDKTGIGVIGVAKEEDIIHIEVLVRIPTYINNYDQQERAFSKTVVNVFEEVVVDIDYASKVLYSAAASSRLNKAKTFIRNIFGGKLTFDNIQLPHTRVLAWLEEEELSYSILSMTIRKFKYDENAVGRFSVQISSQEIGMKLLNDYQDEVRNVVLHVEPKNLSPFVMQCAMQNTISLKCEESDFWKIIELIKRNL